jgi:hypothetical protein
MSQSVPFTVSAAVVAALRAQLEPDGIVRVVLVEDKDDAPIDKPGQAEGRTFGFVVGVINRSAGARAAADADMERVKAIATKAARDACLALQAVKTIVSFQYPRETQRTYRIEGIDVGGALILTRFEIDYRLPATRPAAA